MCRSMRRAPAVLFRLLGLALVAACSSTGEPTGTSTAIEAVSGNNQTAPPRTALPLPITVRATSSAGALSGVPIQFSVLTGDGSLSLSARVGAITVPTDGNGLAASPWVLGPVTGANAQSVVASIVGGTGSVTFLANAIPGPPAGIFFLVQPSTVAGNAPFNPSVQVAIADANGNVVTSVAPTVVTIQSGRAGVVSGGVATTQAGVATFPDLRVCPTIGSADNTIVATAPGYTGVTSTTFVVGFGC